MVDYLSFHTEKYQVSQEQLESSRLSAAKLSPMVCIIHGKLAIGRCTSDGSVATMYLNNVF